MARSSEKKAQMYNFFVDGKPYHSAERRITGEQIHAIAGIPPSIRIFIGDHGPDSPDHQITKEKMVDLAEPGKAQFYTLASPSYDIF